ncbi:MAG: PT domain-containing protein [Clostridia bacterium]|nr:PT domain-containing protein [Clostridia bacterium]
MKKLVIIAISIVLMLLLAACTENKPIEASITEAPTEAPIITDEPTAAPAESGEPTPAPTEASTPEPTEAPTPAPAVEYAFEDCARVIARFTPGEADDQVHYIYDDGFEDGENWGPEYFAVDGSRIYIFDRHNEMLIYDTASGETSRHRMPQGSRSQEFSCFEPFTVSGGKYVASYCTYDFETGESASLQPPRSLLGAVETLFIASRGGEYYVYAEKEEYQPYGYDDIEALEYKLDPEAGAWIASGPFCRWEHTSNGYGDVTLDGCGRNMGRCSIIGMDGEGCIYLSRYVSGGVADHRNESVYTIEKYSPAGDLISSTEAKFNEGEYFYDQYMIAAEDGAVYVMVDYKEETVIIKVVL